MFPASSCSDAWAAELVAAARARLAEISHTLQALRRDVGGLAAEAQWDSRAAGGFRRDADAIAADVTALASEIDQLHDDLRLSRAKPSSWGCW